MNKPELDAAALDELEQCRAPLDEWERSLIAQARLALTQSERIATLEAEFARLQRDTAFQSEQYLAGHGGSWGVCKYQSQVAETQAHAATLRDALEKADAAFNAWGRDEDGIHPDAWPAVEHLREVLKATPAQSLAAHDAEALERAAKRFLAQRPCEHDFSPDECETCHWFATGTVAIRALAAQEVPHA